MQATRDTESAIGSETATSPATDPRQELRTLYIALLTRQERFEEFKRLLAAYPKSNSDDAPEGPEASAMRRTMNQRISQWLGGVFGGLTPKQVLAWRAALVEEQLNTSLLSSLDSG
jgi:hypothetical protein